MHTLKFRWLNFANENLSAQKKIYTTQKAQRAGKEG